jgi:hypothetical protein
MNVQDWSQTLQLRQLNGFRSGHFKHTSAPWNWAMPQRHNHYTCCTQQRSDHWHRNATLYLIEMHPHSRQHNDIKSLIFRAEGGQIWKAVVQPFDDRIPL